MKKIIVANWKMQLSYQASLKLAHDFVKKISGAQGVKNEIIICPDYLSLPAIAVILKKSRLKLGAQDSGPAERGAYTGEVSPADLKAVGVKYVIIGHSERRDHLHENSAIIKAKIVAALKNKLVPILCVGEKLTEKENGETMKFINEQLRHALRGIKIKSAADLIIAYEPVWAISSNKNAQPLAASEADKIQALIKARVAHLLKKSVAVLYGGSVNAVNAVDFLRQKNIDGLLVGGVSLKIAEFKKICQL